MRISCPNCGAQYEVDARVIPDIGRDVQCSNCGHTWFQRPQSAAAASVRRVVEDPPVTPAEDVVPASAQSAASAGGRAAQAFAPISSETDEEDDTRDPQDREWRDTPGDADAADAARPWAAPGQEPEAAAPTGDDTWREADRDAAADSPTDDADRAGQLDDQMRAVLREEAEREARARAAEARPTVEVQADLGLSDETDARPRQRTADLYATDDDPSDQSSAVATAMAAAASRRQNLPDVDSISSSLRSETAASADSGTEDDEGPARGGFRTGFLLTLLLVIVALVIYLYAPALADMVPALRGPLAGYVDAVNGLRGWLDGLLTGATARLNGLAG